MKVAIYSGAIPSTTFIENLIKELPTVGVEVYLFGKLYSVPPYQHKRIFIFPTPINKFLLVPFVLIKKLQLLIRSPKHYKILRKHLHNLPLSSRMKWRMWAKCLPVVLHLPDIFHIQWAKSMEDWYFLQTLFGVKIVISLRGGQINTAPAIDAKVSTLYKQTFPAVAGFHAVSKAIAMQAQQYGARAATIKVVYSGIDLQAIKKFEKNTYEVNNPVQFLSVGRFHWKKGYHYALDALKMLLDRGYVFHYTIIAGEITEELLYQVHDLGLNSFVHIINRIPQQEVFWHMQKADALLLPSVEEGIANVVLEAMAVGLPVISTDYGGMAEVIQQGKNGYLFPNRDVNELANQLEQFIKKTPVELTELAANARVTVAAQHNLAQLGENMLELYKQVL